MLLLILYPATLIGLLLFGAYGIRRYFAPNWLRMLGAVFALTVLVSFLWYALAAWGALADVGGVGYSPDYLVGSYLWWHTMILPVNVCQGLELPNVGLPAACGVLVGWPLPVGLFALGLIGLRLARFGRWAVAVCLLVLVLGLGAYESSVTLADVAPIVRGVPIYPGAHDVWLSSDRLPCTISFTTSDPEDTILAYYRSMLPQRGWVLGESWSDLMTATRPEQNLTVVTQHAESGSKVKLWLRAP